MSGISSVFAFFALAGFLVFLAGIGIVVVSASQGRSVRGGVLLTAFGLVFGVLLTVVSEGIIVVEPQERAVIFQTLSGELAEPKGPGTHIIVPIIQNATVYSVSQQQYTMSGTAYEGRIQGDDAVQGRTQDGQEVGMDITILYRINPLGENVNIVHRNLQNRYEEDFIRPTARGVVREVVAGFTAEEIYGEMRTNLESEMQDQISEQMASQGLELVNLLIRDVNFSEAFTASIEQAVVAQQEAAQANRRVEQRQAEARQEVAVAEGDRDAAIARAQGQAQAVILNAQAQAEALRLISEQIAANPMLIQYEYIQNLSDNVSLALIPSNSHFLFDFNSIAGLPAGDPNFVAPQIPESDLLITPETEGDN